MGPGSKKNAKEAWANTGFVFHGNLKADGNRNIAVNETPGM
jgi:hypothetical protein